MIKLSVEPYCENCDEFEPETSSYTIENISAWDLTERNTDVHCTHHIRCKRMVEHLRKVIENGKEKELDKKT